MKDLGANPFAFPMPVLMIATYDDDGTVNVMNMAWGGICAENMIALNLDETHRTSANIEKRGAFTVSVADVPHLDESDYFGIVSGNDEKDKFARTGMHARRSANVDAPIVEEYPLTMECRVAEIQADSVCGYRVVGEIVNVVARDDVVGEDGKVDPLLLRAFAYDPYRSGYYAIGEKVGQAWESGARYIE